MECLVFTIIKIQTSFLKWLHSHLKSSFDELDNSHCVISPYLTLLCDFSLKPSELIGY